MTNLVRILTMLLFLASAGISLALLMHGEQWTDERAAVLRDIRTVMNCLAMLGFCITMFTGKRKRNSRVSQ